MLEDYVRIFDILLHEKPIRVWPWRRMPVILRARLYVVQRELAYLDRIQGRSESAKRRLVDLIKEWPRQFELYVDLLKAYLPAVCYRSYAR